MESKDPIIQVKHLSKQYKIGVDTTYKTLSESITNILKSPLKTIRNNNRQNEIFWALKDINFEVNRGEVVGIIGRNGAGKSTLLKILSRITQPTEGEVVLRGRVGSLLEVGTGFHPELTGRENIYFNGAILGMKKREMDDKFDDIVKFAEIEKFLDTPVKRYSSGMYVRLAFAVAAHLEPEILIIDEVLAVGDAAFQKKCLGKMEEVAKGGRTVLFVSHNMTAITQLCRKGIWINEGRIKQTGLSYDIVEAYLSTQNKQIAERRWSYPGDAPGDDRVRLLAGRIKQNGQTVSIIDINIPSQIELEFEILREVDSLVAAVNFFNAEGVCLFSNADWRPNKMKAGRYRKYVEMPGQILSEGRFNVLLQLVFYEPDIPSVVVPDALIFEAIDSDHELSVRGFYKGTWPGIVRIGLSWSETFQLT